MSIEFQAISNNEMRSTDRYVICHHDPMQRENCYNCSRICKVVHQTLIESIFLVDLCLREYEKLYQFIESTSIHRLIIVVMARLSFVHLDEVSDKRISE